MGHAHLALLGTFSFWAMGAIYYIIPVTLRRRIYNPGLAEAQFWMVLAGFLLMMLSLQIGGLLQGAAWLNGDTVYKVLPSLKPYLVARAISGTLIVVSGIMQAWNIYKTVTAGEPVSAAAPAPPRHRHRRLKIGNWGIHMFNLQTILRERQCSNTRGANKRYSGWTAEQSSSGPSCLRLDNFCNNHGSISHVSAATLG